VRNDWHGEHGHSVLATLPLVRWAARLQRGTVVLRGHLDGEVDLPLGGHRFAAEGPLALEFDFVGGRAPSIGRVVVSGEVGLIGPVELIGRRLEIGRQANLDGGAVPWLSRERIGPFIAALVDHLDHLRIAARGEPDGDLLVRLGHGVEVAVPAGVPLTISGATTGPAAALQLSEPLVVRFGGEGLRISHDAFRAFSRLACVRLSRATLHPDGSVALESGPRVVDAALKAPLQRASARLSEIVRRSPKFSRVRTFLK
jgi:hypothetical protein